MKIEIHQLLCGEVNKAWGLIKATMPDTGIAKSLAFRTDLQEQTGDINWTPAIRGFAEGDYFLIMKTFEDTSSEVRRGRKFSHVLVVSKIDIVKLESISFLLNLLPNGINKEADIKTLSVDVPMQYGYNNNGWPLKLQKRFNKLIHGYVYAAEYANTIIWIGQDNFDLIVDELWKRMLDIERQSFQFGITFNNDNKINPNIVLLAVPENVQSKFLRSDFFLVNSMDAYNPTEFIEKLLLGDPETQQRLENFEKTIESGPLTRQAISFVGKAIDTFEQLESSQDLKKISSLSHVIATFSALSKQGATYKGLLLKQIQKLFIESKFSEITVFRTFKVDSFKDSEKIISNLLIQWIHKNIFSDNSDPVNFTPFFETTKNSNPNWWNQIINSELKSYLGMMTEGKAAILYSWLSATPSIAKIVGSSIALSLNSEACFLEKLPKKISDELLPELKLLAVANNWFRLYAALLVREYNWEQALTELLKIDVDDNYFEAVNIIIENKDKASIVGYAADLGSLRMIKRAGEICSKEPSLLRKIDIASSNWQMIWLEAIKKGTLVNLGLDNPQVQINNLLDNILAGKEVNQELLHHISLSGYGSLLLYPNRTQVWQYLEGNTKESFLIETAADVLEQLSNNSSTEIPDDDVLAEHILQKGLSDFLYYNRANIKSVIPIFERFSQLKDNNLCIYLENYSGSLGAVEATQLGKLIFKNGFANSARVVYKRADKHNNWKFALAECHFLLDFITKGILALSGILSTVNIPTDEWWLSAENLIIELYPNGISLTTVWKKAGGKESELLMNTTPANSWKDALHKLRRNLFDDISMNDLLKEIKKQYGGNEKFRIIYDLRKNYIKT